MADGNFYPGGCSRPLLASWRTIILLSFIFGNFIRLDEIFLLSKGIDTLAHSWPRGELLLAAFSTSVIYPLRCCQQGFTKWTPDLQFSSFLVFLWGLSLDLTCIKRCEHLVQ